MAATPITVQTYGQGGNTRNAEVAADAVNGNILASNNGTTTQVIATNTGGSSYTLTFTPVFTAGVFAPGTWVVTLTAGQKWASGPLPLAFFGSQPAFTASNAAITVKAEQI